MALLAKRTFLGSGGGFMLNRPIAGKPALADAPTGFVLSTDAKQQHFTLKWTSLGGGIRYTLEGREVGAADWSELGTDLTTMYIWTGRNPLKRYEFRVMYQGSKWRPGIQPPAVSGLTLTAVAGFKVQYDFTAADPDDLVTSYQYKRWFSDSWKAFGSSDGSSTSLLSGAFGSSASTYGYAAIRPITAFGPGPVVKASVTTIA